MTELTVCWSPLKSSFKFLNFHFFSWYIRRLCLESDTRQTNEKLFSGVALVFDQKHFPNWCHMQSDSIKATAIDNPLQFYVKFFIKICVKHNTTNGRPADPRKIQIIEWKYYNDFKLFYKHFFLCWCCRCYFVFARHKRRFCFCGRWYRLPLQLVSNLIRNRCIWMIISIFGNNSIYVNFD